MQSRPCGGGAQPPSGGYTNGFPSRVPFLKLFQSPFFHQEATVVVRRFEFLDRLLSFKGSLTSIFRRSSRRRIKVNENIIWGEAMSEPTSKAHRRQFDPGTEFGGISVDQSWTCEQSQFQR